MSQCLKFRTRTDYCNYFLNNSHFVFWVEHDSLCVRNSRHMMVECRSGQPHTGWQLVVKQRELRDESLCLLLLGRQSGQSFPNAHQRLNELTLRSQTYRLTGGQQNAKNMWGKKEETERLKFEYAFHKYSIKTQGDQVLQARVTGKSDNWDCYQTKHVDGQTTHAW